MPTLRQIVGRDMVMFVREQLPRTLREVYTVSVTTDAYMMVMTATFTDPKGRAFTTRLEDGRIPEDFQAHLTVVV